MKYFYSTFTTIILAFSMNAQTTGQLMDYSLEYIGNNANGNAEIALISTPDFTATNGNSADLGAVITISGGGYLLPGSTGFINDCVFTPPATNICDYKIPTSEWTQVYLAAESTASGKYVYQFIRTPGVENQFFDAVAGVPITMMVFQVTNGSGAPTTGEITLIKNTDPLLDANTGGNESWLNINFPSLPLGTIDLYPGNPYPDDSFTPAFTAINFSLLNTPEAVLEGITMYPNPTVSSFVINGLQEKASVSIVSINGKIVLEQQNYQGEQIDISHLASGIYFVKTTTKNGTVTKKMIKE